MLSLLLFTIATSATDSLNPVGIAEQFILQGLVKKKHHILIYIFAMALTNFTVGVLIYFGAGLFMKNYMSLLLSKYSTVIYICEFILGLLTLMLVLFFIMKSHIKKLQEELSTLKGVCSNTHNNIFKIKSVNPISLFFLGILSTLMELTTALPYFAFLAILLSYNLSIFTVILILIIYNIIYSLPLIILYILYVKCQDKFDVLYSFMKNKIDKYAEILSSLLIGLVGLILIFHSLNSLLKLA